jgi:T5orf172 domain
VNNFGDEPGAMPHSGDGCFCERGIAAHPPVLMIFDPDRGEYVAATGERCGARWATTGFGHLAGQICGREATEEAGDSQFCDHHYKRIRKWMNEREGWDHEKAKRLMRERAQEQKRLDRELAEHQIELDKKRILAEEAARSEHSLVYYVQRESDGLIKIGTSRTIYGRMAALKTTYGPLRLLATHGGTHIEEHAIHDRFAAQRVTPKGEWFRPELPLLEHIDEKRRWHSKMPERLAALPPFVSYGELTAMVAKAGGITDGRRRRRKNGTGTAALRVSPPCDDGAMARAWIELPAASGWADIRLARHALHELAYVTAELRGSGPVLLRVSGVELETGELWRVPGQG